MGSCCSISSTVNIRTEKSTFIDATASVGKHVAFNASSEVSSDTRQYSNAQTSHNDIAQTVIAHSFRDTDTSPGGGKKAIVPNSVETANGVELSTRPTALQPAVPTKEINMSRAITSVGIRWKYLQEFRKEHAEQLTELTTTRVCSEIIKPKTAELKVSFADLNPYMCSSANIFVSHAWTYRFLDLYDAVESWINSQSSAPNDGWCLWIDIFVVNQHVSALAEALNFGFFARGFETVLKELGRALIVLSPWDKPLWMTRAWCLFEFYIVEYCKIEYDFVLPSRDENNFIHALGTGDTAYLDLVSFLDMEKAQAYSAYDEKEIKALVRTNLGGFSVLNERVIGAVRRFCVTKSREALAKLEPAQRLSDRLLNNTAQLLFDSGELEGAVTLYTEYLALLQESQESINDVEICRGKNNLANAYSALGQYDTALALLEEARAGYERQADGGGLGLAETLLNLGAVYRILNRFPEALDCYERARDGFISGLGPAHKEVGMTYGNMGLLLRAMERMDESLDMHRKEVQVLTDCLGPDHATTASAHNNLALVLERLGRYPEALDAYNESLRVRMQALGAGNSSVADVKDNMANVLLRMRRFADAAAMSQEAQDIYAAALREGHPSAAYAAYNQSFALEQLGRPTEAREKCAAAAAALETALGREHPTVVMIAERRETLDALVEMSGRIEWLRGVRGPPPLCLREGTVVFFEGFGTVKADYFCPAGARGYFEVWIGDEPVTPQWGFVGRRFGRGDDGPTADGVGDEAESWGFDGERQLLWAEGESHPYSGRWRAGDVIGLACDLVGKDEGSNTESSVAIHGGGSGVQGSGDGGARGAAAESGDGPEEEVALVMSSDGGGVAVAGDSDGSGGADKGEGGEEEKGSAQGGKNSEKAGDGDGSGGPEKCEGGGEEKDSAQGGKTGGTVEAGGTSAQGKPDEEQARAGEDGGGERIGTSYPQLSDDREVTGAAVNDLLQGHAVVGVLEARDADGLAASAGGRVEDGGDGRDGGGSGDKERALQCSTAGGDADGVVDGDNVGGDRAGSGNIAGGDNIGGDNPGGDNPGGDNPDGGDAGGVASGDDVGGDNAAGGWSLIRGPRILISVNGDFSPAGGGGCVALPAGLEGLFPAFTAAAGRVFCVLGADSQRFDFAPPNPSFRPMAAFGPGGADSAAAGDAAVGGGEMTPPVEVMAAGAVASDE